jgi:Glycine zipper
MFQTRSRLFRLLMLPALLPLFPVIGCASSSNTDRGLVNGGVLGALVGAIAAGPRHALGGALVGGAIGATAGGLTGAAIDNSERKTATRVAAQRALALQDIVALTASGSSDDVIISQIRNSGSGYALRTEDVLYLKNSGVREPVILYMQATGGRPVAIYAQPQPVYVIEQPRPSIGVGIGFR